MHRWSEHPENLFLVEPYMFFPGQRSTVRSLLETERWACCYLPVTLNAISEASAGKM